MDDVIRITKQFIQEELNHIVNEKLLSDHELKLIKLRYGLDGEPQSLKRISRVTSIKLKNVKREVEEAERKLFNLLKKKI